MTDRGILFSAPMVRALLAGTKTQTRRVVKPQPEPCDHSMWRTPLPNGERQTNHANDTFQPWITEDGLCCALCGNGTRLDRKAKGGVGAIRLPAAKGDRLWVREAWATVGGLDAKPPRDVPDGAAIYYDADPVRPVWRGKGRTARYMCRWMSRLTLHVTDVRVQRLQAITGRDAAAEGVQRLPGGEYRNYTGEALPGWVPLGVGFASPIPSYATLWEHLNGAGSWEANPWVVAITFTVERANIDAAAP